MASTPCAASSRAHRRVDAVRALGRGDAGTACRAARRRARADRRATPLSPLPRNLDRAVRKCATRRLPAGGCRDFAAGRVWLCRPLGSGSFGPFEANALDAALLANFSRSAIRSGADAAAARRFRGPRGVASARKRCACRNTSRSMPPCWRSSAREVCACAGSSRASATARSSSRMCCRRRQIGALANARVVAMEPAAIARVTRLPEARPRGADRERCAAGTSGAPFRALGRNCGHPARGRSRAAACLRAERERASSRAPRRGRARSARRGRRAARPRRRCNRRASSGPRAARSSR